MGTPNSAPREARLREQIVDEAAAESFPASDAPAWNATQPGAPAPHVAMPDCPAEVRSQIRDDLLRLELRGEDPGLRRRVREELIARAMLNAVGAAIREPIDDPEGVRNVESELRGLEREEPCAVVAARYDVEDASRLAMLLAVVRARRESQLRRTIRFVAFADSNLTSGAVRYAERLQQAGVRVHAVFTLGRVSLDRTAPDRVFLTGGGRAWPLVRDAAESFGHSSRILVRPVPIPSWWPGVRRSDASAFGRRGWRAFAVADHLPGRAGRGAVSPDVDRMASAVPGVVAAVERLAGSRL